MHLIRTSCILTPYGFQSYIPKIVMHLISDPNFYFIQVEDLIKEEINGKIMQASSTLGNAYGSKSPTITFYRETET